MQSPREDMRKTLEKAVIIESAKTDSGFKYTYASKEAYKIVFIKNDLFHCIPDCSQRLKSWGSQNLMENNIHLDMFRLRTNLRN